MRGQERPQRGGGVARTEDLRVKASWLYFIEGLTQEQVARHLNVSRLKVLRLLATSRAEGLVQIRINARSSTQIALGRELEATFGLDEAVVVPSPGREEDVAEVVGHAVGTYVSDRIHDGMSLGIGWGATLHASLRAVAGRPMKNVAVVSLLGGLAHSSSINPSAVAWRVSDAFEAENFQLTAPVYVTDPALRDALWKLPQLQELLERARRVDLALISVGEVSKEATIFRTRILPRDQIPSLRRAGAVGDVLCHFLDETGALVNHRVNRCVMAVPPHDLRRVARVVIAAGGRRKVTAILAALKATRAAHLITDEATARGLLGACDRS